MRFLLGVLRFIAGLYILAVSVPAVLALFGYWVPFLDLFNHLQFGLFIGTLIGLIVAIALEMRLGRMVALAGIIASSWTFGPELLSSFAPRPEAAPGATVLKVMTHNLFGLNYDMARVAAVIAAEKPDIVAVQEYFPEQGKLDELLKADYPFSVRCQGGKRANLGLYSKLPFDKEMSAEDCPKDAYGEQRTAHIIAGFALPDGTHFSLMTTHLDWPIGPAQLGSLADVPKLTERQAAEYKVVEDTANAVKGPLLVVGDFNSTPWSYAMKGFEAATGLERETRNLITYPLMFTVPRRISKTELLDWVPFLPLDQVFERGIDVTEIHRGDATGSDHLPVVFSFAVSRD